MRYTYDVCNARTGEPIECGFSSEEEAYEYTQIQNITDYTIQKREHYTVTGLGRDPDLH